MGHEYLVPYYVTCYMTYILLSELMQKSIGQIHVGESNSIGFDIEPPVFVIAFFHMGQQNLSPALTIPEQSDWQ